ncbi:MAG: hypothetical protein H7328_10235 [Bdellovibrio sp.]|nr:hypothetical protein [Bdellovibrio sp.]
MKKLLIAFVFSLSSFAFADVCQIKPNQNMGAALINIYALMKGEIQISASTFSRIDLESLVELRESLIEKGLCTAEVDLEKCSITLDVRSNNPVILNIGQTELERYGSTAGVDKYSLDVAANTIQSLQAKRICN